jgi:hypothetical protein
MGASFTLQSIEFVDVELQLLIDISGSVNSQEYDLQMLGYKAAFESDIVQNSIINGTRGSIAVQLIMWSGRNQQQVMIDWSLIDSASSADSFGTAIENLARPFSGWTATGSAITFSYPLFQNNGFSGSSQIMDISGDGTKNSGINLETASNNAIAAGIERINGIVITTDQRVIDEYSQEVVNGSNAFLLAPANFNDFQKAIENKIVAEISNVAPPGNVIKVPEPNPLLLMLISLIYIYLKPYFKRRTS